MCDSCVCVSELCVRELCVSRLSVRELDAGAGGGADWSAQPKTRTPHKDVGNNILQ